MSSVNYENVIDDTYLGLDRTDWILFLFYFFWVYNNETILSFWKYYI